MTGSRARQAERSEAEPHPLRRFAVDIHQKSRRRRLLWRTLLPRRGRITQITYPNSTADTLSYNVLDTRVGSVDSTRTNSLQVSPPHRFGDRRCVGL